MFSTSNWQLTQFGLCIKFCLYQDVSILRMKVTSWFGSLGCLLVIAAMRVFFWKRAPLCKHLNQVHYSATERRVHCDAACCQLWLDLATKRKKCHHATWLFLRKFRLFSTSPKITNKKAEFLECLNSDWKISFWSKPEHQVEFSLISLRIKLSFEI